MKENNIKDFIQAPNSAELISKVRLVKQEQEGYAAIILHDKDTEHVESCLLFMDESGNVSQALPINSDLSIEIDLNVTFTLKQDSACVIFPGKDIMSLMLDKTKELVTMSAKDQDFEWIEALTTLQPPSRLNLMESHLTETLRRVLPLQRQETIENINLKRTRTVNAVKQRSLTLDGAKEHYLNAQLKKKENEFVEWEKAITFVGTWNVHGSAPTESFKDWLQGTLKTKDGKPVDDPDFYVIGLQEMETNKEAYIRYDPEKETAWIKAILGSLKDEGRDYYKVESLQLVTLLLIVISKKAHQPHISEVSKTYAGVGLMNMMGNKGGIAIRLRFHDSYLCFVTSHLAAFTDKIERRNQDFAELSKRLLFNHNYTSKTSYISFSWNDGGDEGVTFLENNNVVKDWRRNASVFHNDFLIWCGDLNYRINLGEAVVKDYLRQDEMDLLLKYDQLSIERSAGRTFSMFDEGEITFSPTYKYDAGTNQYDTSEKRRAPSWTDRILWKKENTKTGPQRLKLLSYMDCMEMMMSDHKPVRALMSLDIRKIYTDMQKKTLLDITQHLAETKDEQPYGELSSSFVEFEDVHFMEYKEKLLTLTNAGRVLTFFEFIQKVDEKSVLPPWLQVTPLSGVIAPGEKVVLRFEITVDPTNSTALNLGEEQLDDVLVLHLEDSRDFFVSVTGNYKRTCLGLPLENLDKMSVPIIGATREKLLGPPPSDSDSSSSSNEDTTLTENVLELPKPLWKLLNFLWNENMFKLESLFLKHGDFIVSSYIRKCLDQDEPFDPTVLLGENISQLAPTTENAATAQTVPDDDDDNESEISNDIDAESKSANSMIDVLITFLDCLPEPIISTHFYERALSGSESSISYMKENLDFCHRNALLYIGVFLRQAIDHAPESCRAEREAAIIENFTVLLRPPIDFKERSPVEAKQKREKFIAELLKTLKI